MLDWLFGRDLDKVLNETKKVKIGGIRFTIRKINVIDHMAGSAVLRQTFDIYKTKPNEPLDDASDKKIRKHYSEVFVAGVVEPKLTFKEEPDCILVDKMFFDWDIVVALYTEIMAFTYGKKKVRRSISAAKN